MSTITVPSQLVALESDRPLTPAMMSAIWEIASVIDERRITPTKAGAWLDIEAARLKGPDARDDNAWLRVCLERLTGVQIGGRQSDGTEWGAVLLAEWELPASSHVARLFLSPAAISALRSGVTFTKIEVDAAHRLPPNARRLYALLADKKRMRQTHWTYDLYDFREQMGVSGKYRHWRDLRRAVIEESIDAINDYGTVEISWRPVKSGRSVTAVRFDWSWKDLKDAESTAAENARHSAARRQPDGDGSAPPLTSEGSSLMWWHRLSTPEKNRWIRAAKNAGYSFNESISDAARDWAFRQMEMEV